MVKVRSSRRVAGLKPRDYDHEIGLVNHDAAEDDSASTSASATDTRTASTVSRLVSLAEDGEQTGEPRASSSRIHPEEVPDSSSQDNASPQNAAERDGSRLDQQESLPHPLMQPSIEVQAATPDVFSDPTQRIVPRRPHEARETAIDILYENERGGFLCGTALFSSKALGGLDPPAWTNAFHKPSPTNIHTAVVPDPSWEWVWPEWRVNYQDGVDEGGWEYSFAFAKAFSWHLPKWWNSFVRRRAWIRKRARRRDHDTDSSGNLLNPDYFSVRPTSHSRKRKSTDSLASSRALSKSSGTHRSIKQVDEEPLEIKDIDTLLSVLRTSRIDREKREAVENYLEHAMDLNNLQHEMHEIMSIFVFQASRRQLLGHLMRKYDELVSRLAEEGNKYDETLLQRKEALEAAVKHADEEVRELAYWSDVKKMAERGLEEDQSWYDAHPGLDRSGPRPPNGGKLPESK